MSAATAPSSRSSSVRAGRSSAGTAGPARRRPVSLWASLGLALVGLVAAAYLAYEHATGTTTLACPETGVVNCLKVTTSSWSTVLGVPVAYAGAGFFVALVGLVVAELVTGSRRLALLRLAATSLGMVAVAYLLWAEVSLRAICLWCTAVHVTTFLLFCVSVVGEALREPAAGR